MLHRNKWVMRKRNISTDARHAVKQFTEAGQEVLQMECTVSWTGHAGTRSSMGFVAETGSGHILTMDGAPDAARPENGGQNLAPRPMETVLAGTGGCTAYDVVMILRRGRHQVEGCSVRLTSERAEKDPKVFTRIHMHFTVTGRAIPEAAVERAISLSHETYCSASIMLAKTAQITTSYELVDSARAASA
ncbi:putative redox protein [Pseudacidovorax intermedius]|uniref:Putative redox protein n=2 Tax=Pseudacidovorax intermedius TaxID=433924 RepID=A0A370FIM9_9BURK|nr:putative redox protein [Pseudacidovorax intermedius]